MARRIPAIPTEHAGIVFRSKLEAKYAKAFDVLGIAWLYEEVNFEFDDGTRYAPDFYMPEIDTFFEVKGMMDGASRRKIELLAREGNRVVVGGPDGSMRVADGSKTSWFDEKAGFGWFDAAVACDAGCGKTFFVGECNYSCTACGNHDGDHHLAFLSDNLFSQAGW